MGNLAENFYIVAYIGNDNVASYIVHSSVLRMGEDGFMQGIRDCLDNLEYIVSVNAISEPLYNILYNDAWHSADIG